MQKRVTNKVTSYHLPFKDNLVNKIQKTSQFCTKIENLTPTIQSSQKIRLKILKEPSLAPKTLAIPLLPAILPCSQENHLPNP